MPLDAKFTKPSEIQQIIARAREAQAAMETEMESGQLMLKPEPPVDFKDCDPGDCTDRHA